MGIDPDVEVELGSINFDVEALEKRLSELADTVTALRLKVEMLPQNDLPDQAFTEFNAAFWAEMQKLNAEESVALLKKLTASI